MTTPDMERALYRLVLYGHPVCGLCQSLKAWLDRRGMPYEERHIADFDGDCLRDGFNGPLLWAVTQYGADETHRPSRVEDLGTPILFNLRTREVIFDAKEAREVCA